ncbi:hypothetical protein ACOMHN_027204 [Nucella lapillus]
MPQTDNAKLLRGLPPETDIHIPGATSQDQVLSRLNKNYRLSKAQQILRLLKDQDALNQRFRDCDLLDDDDDSAKNKERGQQDDSDAWSLEEEQQSEGGDSDLSENEAERRAARHVALRKHRNSMDPGRCNTSMGFYNQAEVTEVPYDTDSDNVNSLDSACSTPRGDNAGATSARQPAKQTVCGQTNPSHNARARVHQPNAGSSEVTTVKELSLSEADHLVQSARSSRPKTSLTTSSSTRSRYYRQQPHPEVQPTPTAPHGHHTHLQPFPQPQGMGETRQAIISRLDPYHPMAVKPFCETRPAREETTRAGTQTSQTSKNGFRHAQGGTPLHFAPSAVALYDVASVFSKDGPVRSLARRSTGAGCHGSSTAPSRSSSFLEQQRLLQPASRALLSVDSSPLLAEVSPRARVMTDDPNRRSTRLRRVKKRVGEMPRGSVPSPMHVLTERAHPSVTVMKLPPLETAVSKPVGAGRDLVCVGKD